MKKAILLIAALAITFASFAQGRLVAPSSWTIKRIGVSFGADQERVQGMDYKYFLSTIEGPTLLNYENINLQQEYLGSMICENPNIRVNITLLPPLMKNTELNLALVGIFNRIDYVSYETPSGNWNDPNFQHLYFDATTNEIAFEGVFTKRAPLGRAFNLYIGAGTNLGVSYGGNLRISGHNIIIEDDSVLGLRNDPSEEQDWRYPQGEYLNEDYDMKSAFGHRVFGQLGLGLLIAQRVEFGFDYRYGAGYRAVGNAPLTATILESYGFSLRWVLR